MFSYPVEFKRPQTLEQACQFLSDPEAKILSGGQSLVAAMKLRLAAPSAVVSLAGIPDLNRIECDGTFVRVGAMVRHAQVASSAEVKRTLPALAVLANGIGDRQVRNMGTTGGSIANNDPAADYPAAVLALRADVYTHRRSIAADDFFRGIYETALAPDEIITRVDFRIPRRSAYVKFKQPASRFATVGVFVADFGEEVRVTVTGAASCVFRVQAMESALGRQFTPHAVAGSQVAAADRNSDMHATAEYRAHLVTVLARRAVELASSAS